MVQSMQSGRDLLRELDIDAAPPPPLTGASLPIPPDPGLLSHLHDLHHAIYTPYYNKFRLAGYMAQVFYSGVLRATTAWMDKNWGQKLRSRNLLRGESFRPGLFTSDWKDAPRSLLNVGEAILFIIPGIFDHLRERRDMRKNVGKAIAAEIGKDIAQVSSADIRHSENPLLQTQTSRFRNLLTLRYVQPLTFLWSLRLGISATVFQIIAERSAFFEKNAYDQLYRLVKEVGNNEWGSWSQGQLVSRLVQVVQESRIEHKAAPITVQEMEQYLPLLDRLAKHLMERDWRFAESVYVLGELIKDPGHPDKVEQAFNRVETLGLEGIARQRSGELPLPITDEPSALAEKSSNPGFVTTIMARGPKARSAEMAQAGKDPTVAPAAQR